MTKTAGLLSTIFSLCLSAVAAAQSGNTKVQVSTIADTSAVVAGKPFWLGFKFTVEPGWHIYWTNPGDSGLATQVKLSLPEGFTAGELKFPIPSRLPQPGDQVNYGYEDEVMLMVQVTPPKALPAGSVKIAGKATWLVCKEDCLPGGKPISLELPVADSAVPANQDDFKQWSAKLPVKDDAETIAKFTVTGSITDGNGTGTIDIAWKKTPTDIGFIPGLMKTGEIAEVKITPGDATMVTFSIKNKKDKNPVTGLVTYTRANGTKTALEISIPAGASPKVELPR